MQELLECAFDEGKALVPCRSSGQRIQYCMAGVWHGIGLCVRCQDR